MKTFKLKFWTGVTFHSITGSFKSYNEAYKFIYGLNGLPLTVKYINNHITQ